MESNYQISIIINRKIKETTKIIVIKEQNNIK